MPPKGSQENQQDFNPDIDRHHTFKEGMQRILKESDVPDVAIERLEVNFLATGDCTYRFWTPRAEESDGGYLPPL